MVGDPCPSLINLLEQSIEHEVFPGAAFAVGTQNDVWLGFAGRHTYSKTSPKIDKNTRWDIASLTKVVATTPTAMILFDQGLLDLDDPVSRYLPRFKHQATIRDLLRHQSGLPPYINVTDLHIRDDVLDRIYSLDLQYEPKSESVYSCVGFVILQQVLETTVAESLGEWTTMNLYQPLKMNQTGFQPPQPSECAPTENLPEWQKKLENERGFKRVQDEFVQGDVHDPIACVMGGVSGNAGLFSTATDLACYLQAILKEGQGIIDPKTLRSWTTRQNTSTTRALGWDTKSPEGSSAGNLFSPNSYGHTGYTGTSIWIDPDKQIFAVLLTNRVHPTSDNLKITEFRPRFHDEVFRFLVS